MFARLQPQTNIATQAGASKELVPSENITAAAAKLVTPKAMEVTGDKINKRP